jgi:hypothetical protein
MLPGECVQSDTVDCTECGQHLSIQVCQSPAGYYIGFWCPNCGPYSRESFYYKTKEAAEAVFGSGDWGTRWKRDEE